MVKVSQIRVSRLVIATTDRSQCVGAALTLDFTLADSSASVGTAAAGGAAHSKSSSRCVPKPTQPGLGGMSRAVEWVDPASFERCQAVGSQAPIRSVASPAYSFNSDPRLTARRGTQAGGRQRPRLTRDTKPAIDNIDNTEAPMTNPETFHSTQEGLSDLQTELRELRQCNLRAAMERLRGTRDTERGWDAASLYQAQRKLELIQSRIRFLEDLLSLAELLGPVHSSTETVRTGTIVTVRNGEGEQERFTHVDPREADPLRARISIASPVGQAVLDRKIGDTVEVLTPGGRRTLEILSIGSRH